MRLTKLLTFVVSAKQTHNKYNQIINNSSEKNMNNKLIASERFKYCSLFLTYRHEQKMVRYKSKVTVEV